MASDQITLYNCRWGKYENPLLIEMSMIRRGGQWKKKGGELAGNGLFFHMRRFQEMLWPEKKWHKWSILELETYCAGYKTIAVLGPASSGKTFDAATNVLADYYVWSDCTTVIVSSTEISTLEMRVWGEIKKMHRLAKGRFDFLPGNLIESKQRIVTDSKLDAVDGRDFRNGICGVPCKKGNQYQGLSAYVGIKNRRVRLVADESSLLPRAFLDSLANLGKNRDFICLALGNPKDTTDALGLLAEPSAAVGGWDGRIDQTPETKTWPTKFKDGICIQLPGTDSPNLDGKLGIPIITQEQIDNDVAFFGTESTQFLMMDMGQMPRGAGLRRVITRQQCLKFGAMEAPIWKDEQRTKIAGLDASYSAVGEGDRTILIIMEFGQDVNGVQLLALTETILVPISALDPEIPEDQVALFVKSQCEQRDIAPQNVFFDSTGRGTLMSAFARLWSPNVVPVEFGGKPSERLVDADIRLTDKTRVIAKDYYNKKVSELWFAVAHVIRASQFRGLTEDVMMEGCMREWGFTGANKIDVEKKSLTKAKNGRSPDLFDALATAVEGAIQRGFVIQTKLAAARPVDETWKDMLRDRVRAVQRKHSLTYT